MEVKVYTAHDEMRNIEELKPNPRNPNKHPEKQIDLLAKIIQEQGWRTPITVSKRSGLIVRGHARLEAAQKLGLKQVPVDLQEYESDEKEWADTIADNKIAELAQIDYPQLKDILQDLDTGDFDMDLTGFDIDDLEHLFAEYEMPGDDFFEVDDSEPKDKTKEMTCPECGHVFRQ